MTAAVPPELADHPLRISIPVQWGDQDSFGHVNNVVHFRWMESARIAYFAALGAAIHNEGLGPILASIKCDFRRQLQYPDTVHVSASITKIGRTSLTMVHRVYSDEQRALVSEGDSVIVMFDYTAQKPTPVPEAVRAKIEELEKSVKHKGHKGH
jgi:acyl-CoA thioester hydrolase